MSESRHDLDLQCPSRHESRQLNKTRRRPGPSRTASAVTLLALAASVPVTMAQANCLSLQGSSVCPAFGAASISTNLTGDLYVGTISVELIPWLT